MVRESGKRRTPGRAWSALSVVVALSSVLGTSACNPAPFVKASDSFAQATIGGIDALSPSFATASSLCRTRARMHFLATRGLGDNDTEWTAWYARHKLTKTEFTWKDHCEALQRSDEMLKKGLAAVSWYARVLKGMVDVGTYDGVSLESTVKDASALGVALAQNQTATKNLTDKVQNLASPIGWLGQQILERYAAKELRQTIREGAPKVALILGALKAYNEAVAATFTDADSLLNNVINVANSSLMIEDYGRAEERARELSEWAKGVAQDPKSTPDEQKRAANEARLAAEDAQEAFDFMTRKAPASEHRVWRRIRPDALKVLEIDGFARRSAGEISAVRDQWTACATVLSDLEKANSALLDAANGKMKDEDARRVVAGLADDVILQVATLKRALEQGRTEP